MLSITPISLLFVCMGNHCRSPSAHAIATKVARERNVSNIVFDSAGTTSHHRGDMPHPLASAEGARRGYRVDHIARLIHPDDFSRFDLIVAMDSQNIDDLRRLSGSTDQRVGSYRNIEPTQVQLLRRWDPYAMPGDENLADPWGRGASAYWQMYDVLERSIPPMLDHLAWVMSESV